MGWVLPLYHYIQTHPASYLMCKTVFVSGVKWLEHEVNKTPQPSEEVTNIWSFTFTPPIGTE
jgi:hypothetical protein